MAARKRSTGKPSRPEVVSLLAAARADPDDPAPRLVLADWLEEHGDEPDRARAELIRAQLELDAFPPGEGCGPRHARLVKQVDSLTKRHKLDWLGLGTGSVRRGLTHLTVPVINFLENKNRLAKVDTEEWAWVEGVSIDGPVSAKKAREVAQSPLLASLGSLSLHLDSLEAVDGFVASPHLGRLRSLAVRWSGDGRPGMAALAQCPDLAGLRSFAPSWDGDKHGALAALAESPYLTGLTALQLNRGFQGRSYLGPEDATFLARSELFATLRTLDLKSNALGWPGLRELLSSPYLTRLTALRMPFQYWTQAPDGQPLPDGPHLPSLEVLDLGRGHAESGHLVALAESGVLRHIKVLLLSDNRIDDRGADALAGSLGGNIRQLDLSVNRLSDAGVGAVASAPWCRHLLQLDLSGNRFADSGALAVADSPHFGNIVHLGLQPYRDPYPNRAAPLSPETIQALQDRFGGRVRLPWLPNF